MFAPFLVETKRSLFPFKVKQKEVCSLSRWNKKMFIPFQGETKWCLFPFKLKPIKDVCSLSSWNQRCLFPFKLKPSKDVCSLSSWNQLHRTDNLFLITNKTESRVDHHESRLFVRSYSLEYDRKRKSCSVSVHLGFIISAYQDKKYLNYNSLLSIKIMYVLIVR